MPRGSSESAVNARLTAMGGRRPGDRKICCISGLGVARTSAARGPGGRGSAPSSIGECFNLYKEAHTLGLHSMISKTEQTQAQSTNWHSTLMMRERGHCHGHNVASSTQQGKPSVQSGLPGLQWPSVDSTSPSTVHVKHRNMRLNLPQRCQIPR